MVSFDPNCAATEEDAGKLDVVEERVCGVVTRISWNRGTGQSLELVLLVASLIHWRDGWSHRAGCFS